MFSVRRIRLLLTILCCCVPLWSGVANAKRAKRKPSQENSYTAPAAPPEISAKLKKAIESILPPKKYSDLKVGILVQSVPTAEVLYERNADELLIPASVNKVMTGYAALKKLKPNATFKTTLYTKGLVKNGNLMGDLYVRGGGDPSLVSERMWMLVNEFLRTGIQSVSGNLICDSSYFDMERTPESRPKYLKDQAYNAPVGAFSFNFNTTTIYVRPNESVGQPPIVYTDPQNSYIDVVNQATTGRQGGKNTVQVSRTEYVKGDIGDTVLLRGSIPSDHKELRFYRNIVNPTLYAGHMMKNFFDQRGIKISGNVVEGTVPAGTKEILEFESQPLWHIVWGMNKFSNNFVADQVMKKLGAEAWGPPGSLQKGLTAVGDALEDIGIPRKSYRMDDGSGLTRNTHVTPRQIVKVLFAGYHDFSISPEFVASMGIAGEDGTLRNRFPSSIVQNQLRGKTGTLDGVTALAGYVPSADGELIAFAILLNDPKVKYGKMSSWVDQVAVAISKFSKR